LADYVNLGVLYPRYSDNFIRSSCKAETEKAVVESRITLQNNPYMESGAFPIMHDLIKRGIKPPSVATINRILKKHGLTETTRRYQKSGIDIRRIR